MNPATAGNKGGMSLLLGVLAAILAVVGVVQLLQGQIIFGIVLLIVACLVGPGGYSLFRGRSTA
jgi:hypothetical protein